ncbi:MAG: hypothetical protein R3A47_08775 [Polyangiales bacterium]
MNEVVGATQKPWLDDAWARVVERWDDDDAHQRFLTFCTSEGALGDAAARYRALIESSEHAGVAQKQLSRIVILATQQLDSMAGQPPRARSALRWFALLFMLGCFATALYLWSVYGSLR